MSKGVICSFIRRRAGFLLWEREWHVHGSHEVGGAPPVCSSSLIMLTSWVILSVVQVFYILSDTLRFSFFFERMEGG